MKKIHSMIIWALFYAINVYYIYHEFTKINGTSNINDMFLKESLFRIQKFLYNSSIFFTFFLFIIKVPFNSTMFVGRCKKEVPLYLIIYGLKNCAFYVLYTLLMYIGFPLVLKQKMNITSDVILNTSRLYSFILAIYFIYLIVYIITNKQVLGLLSIYVINLTILTIYYSISFGLGINTTTEKELHFLTMISSIVSLLLVFTIIYKVKYKDYI